MKIKFNLSEESLEDTISKLTFVKKQVEEAKVEAVKEVVNETVKIIVDKLIEDGKVDTGATIESTKAEYKDGKVYITQEGDHVYENEFGDGEYANEEGGYPEPSLLPPTFPTHNSQYKFIPEPNSKYYETYQKKKAPLVSYGQPPTAQMWTGSQYAKQELNSRIRQKVRDKLSKI